MTRQASPCVGCRFRQRVAGEVGASACGLVEHNPVQTYAAAMLGELEPPAFDAHGVGLGECEWPLTFDARFILTCQHRAPI
jgi:hypothetical protein